MPDPSAGHFINWCCPFLIWQSEKSNCLMPSFKRHLFAEIAQTNKNFAVPEKYFSAITCFLTFNLAAFVGNLLPAILKWVRSNWTQANTKAVTVTSDRGIISYCKFWGWNESKRVLWFQEATELDTLSKIDCNLNISRSGLKSFLISQPNPRTMFVPIVARVAFVPFFLLCNYQVGKGWCS